jgi:hypothetical protein
MSESRPQLKREWSLVPNFRRSQREFSRRFKHIARARIPEFESSHPSHAVSLRVRSNPYALLF